MATSSSHAVYAPTPVVQAQQGKQWSIEVSAGAYYDDNIFGAAENEQTSWVGIFGLDLGYSGRSNQDQTGYRFGYEGSYLIHEDRPGDAKLDNHTVWLSLDHQFSDRLSITLSERLSFVDEPDSAIGTTTLQTDQSSLQNVLNLAVNWDFHERFFVINKYRNTHYNYDAAALKASLDRNEHLYGFEFGYIKSERLNIIGEYRLQMQRYRDDLIPRDSDSHFFLMGADYSPSEQASLECRIGAEVRDREGGENTTEPFAEVRATYDYAARSYMSAGFTYTLTETSDTSAFTDTETAELEANISHYLSDMIVAGASVTYAIELLQGRVGVADVEEDTLRFGISLSYAPRKSLVVSVTYDYDQVFSGIESRDEIRNRVGIKVGHAF